jgi:hypothetical protein
VGYYNTFVVKIWSDTCGQMTRGHIQHVRSQELVHFRNMTSLTDFIMNHLMPPSGEPAASESLSTSANPASNESGDMAEDG